MIVAVYRNLTYNVSMLIYIIDLILQYNFVILYVKRLVILLTVYLSETTSLI